MNEKVLRHKEICDGLNELYARKNHDYGDSFHTTFVEEGLAMARIRLGDKFSRFKTLSRLSCNDRDQQQVTDESIRDTLLDLANYAIMTVLEMDTPDESHATLYAYDKPIYAVGEDPGPSSRPCSIPVSKQPAWIFHHGSRHLSRRSHRRGNRYRRELLSRSLP